ncbi:glucosyltransferase domain-containing protein, partial [Huaxiibacter chinensis]|uniref:glucosyltransferase domain-containing protein n=1 Tax=Huaxiibacter chinensis TaxID=2899785 RepID=UPI003D314379
KINCNYKDFVFLALIFSMPFIIADVPYIDDLARMAVGYGWNQDGRVFATLLMKTLSLGYPLMDISPIPTLLAISSLVLAGYILSEVFEINGRLNKAIIAISMLSGPFIVQNLSYQWDSLPMSLSMLLITCSIMFINNRNMFIFMTSIMLTLSMYLYQATIFAFPCLVILYLWKSYEGKGSRETVKLIITASLASVAFIFTYKLSSLLINLEYSQSRADLVFFSSNPLVSINNNIMALESVYKPYFSSITGKLVIFAYAISVLTLLKCSLKKNALYALLGIVLPPAFMIMASIVGVVIVNAPISPRVFSALPLSILTIVILSKNSRYSFVFVGVIVSFITIIQLYAYVNALKSEYELQKSIITQIAAKNDLYNKKIIINGSAPMSNGAQITLKHLPYLKGSIPIYLNNGWVWGRQLMENEGLIFKEQLLYSPDLDKQRNKAIKALCDIPVTTKSNLYTVRSNNSFVIIDFMRKQCH